MSITGDLFADQPVPAPVVTKAPAKTLRKARFNGSDYLPAKDDLRLTGQIERVFKLMIDGRWRTLDEISRATNDPHASISAQLRHLRKPSFGGFVVEKRARGDRAHGLFEYRLLLEKEEC